MKKKVLALILGLAMVLTTVVCAEVITPDTELETPVPEEQVELAPETPDDDTEVPEEDGEVLPDAKESAEPEETAVPETEAQDDTEVQEPETQEPEVEQPTATDEPAVTVTQAPEMPEDDEPWVDEEPVVTETPAESEAPDESEQPAAPETPEETEVPEEAPAFTASVKIKLKNQEQLYYGDSVTLQAIVEGANAAYTVRWAYYDVEASLLKNEAVWVECFTGEEYTFIVNESNAILTYRVVVGDTIKSTYTLPTVLEHPEEAEPVVESGEEVRTDEVSDEVTDQEFELEVPTEVADGLVPELDPDRTVDIHAEWEGGVLHFGDGSTLVADLKGYDNAVYTLQWQTSKDNVNWVDVAGATELCHQMIVTEENYLDYWRVVVTVTEVTE